MSHRRMSPAARRHMLQLVERLAAPMFMFAVMVSGAKLTDGAAEKIRRFIEEHRRPNFHSVLVLPTVVTRIDLGRMGINSKSVVVRVCAGKGGRHRGVRGRRTV